MNDTELAVLRAAMKSIQIDIERQGDDVDPALIRVYRQMQRELKLKERIVYG